MITLAIDRYDRHFPFFDGTVPLPPGLEDLQVKQAGPTSTLRDGAERHERMLRDGEFDAAETSLASYLVARSRGLPFTAIPVFPRRLFSQGQIFVNTDAGIRGPQDLAGRTIGLQSFQTTLAVLAKGDLAAEYGVDLKSIKWRVRSDDTVKIDYPDGFDIAPLGGELVDTLCSGETDAIFYSRTPTPPAALAYRITRLFTNPRAEEQRFVTKYGYWPIMHVVALRNDSVTDRPGLPASLMNAFDAATGMASSYLADPNWSRQPWAKYTLEDEQHAFAQPLWTSGLEANQANLDRFIGYAADQGLIDRPLEAAALFDPSVIDT